MISSKILCNDGSSKSIRTRLLPLCSLFMILTLILSGCKPAPLQIRFRCRDTNNTHLCSFSNHIFHIVTGSDKISSLHLFSIIEDSTPSLLLSSLSPNGEVVESVHIETPEEVVFDEDFLYFFSAEDSYYLITKYISPSLQNSHQINIIEINPFDLTSSLEVKGYSIENDFIQVSGAFSFNNHLYFTGSYQKAVNTNPYGLILDMEKTTSTSELIIANSWLLQIPRKVDGNSYSKTIACIGVQNRNDETRIHFATDNGYVGTLLPNGSTQNCFTVPGYHPRSSDSVFYDGDILYLTNRVDSSYSADIIQVFYNGKTSHTQLFNQYPDIEFSFYTQNSNNDGNEGFIALGCVDSKPKVLTSIPVSFHNVNGWNTSSLNYSTILSSAYQDQYFYLSGFQTSIVQSDSDMPQNNDYKTVLFTSFRYQLGSWTPKLQKLKVDEIVDQETEHIYLKAKESGVLDCRSEEREVRFVKPFQTTNLQNQTILPVPILKDRIYSIKATDRVTTIK